MMAHYTAVDAGPADVDFPRGTGPSDYTSDLQAGFDFAVVLFAVPIVVPVVLCSGC